MALTGVSALIAAKEIGFVVPVAAVLGGLFTGSVLGAVRFLQRPTTGKAFEVLSGIWTLCLYLLLGVIPLAWRLLN
jgi:4-hydroxybenzoate polyprenyltransferase